MSFININNLTFGYEGSTSNIFENVSLQIDGSWKLGLIGRNGRGKTTLLNLIMGNYEYQGSITTDLEFAYFPYQVEDKQRLTLEVMQEICPQAEDWECIKETSLLQVDAECLYREFSTLSNGEKTKVLLAALFLGENRFLLLDEPTNHVDIEGRKTIQEYLNKKQGFIVVSHDRDLLDHCIDHVISINRASIDVQQGNFSSWWDGFKRAEQNELAENEKLQKEIKHLNDAARQSAGWSSQVEKSKNGTTNSGSKLDKGFVSHKAAKMMQRSKNFENRMEKAAEDKSKLLKNVDTMEPLKMEPALYFKQTLVTAKEVSAYYDNIQVFKPTTFEINQGDRICVTGPNGCGKSTLLKLIQGENINHTGDLQLGSQLVISYAYQDTSNMSGTVSDFAEKRGVDLTLLLTMLRKLGFEREQFQNTLESMSEGQKKKVLLASSLCEKAHLYIWDEPLNYIDIISRMQIEELILEYKPTILFVEHDSMFQNKIANKRIVL